MKKLTLKKYLESKKHDLIIALSNNAVDENDTPETREKKAKTTELYRKQLEIVNDVIIICETRARY